ncbi:MAG: hypothetical protein Q8P15_03425, partial [Nanoarchaeota archaeon]|nr:hypothetical protein [Nanoarchaeota archaeon]
IVECVKEFKYSSKDVRDFSIQLKKYENEFLFSQKAGLILSALINNSTEESFEVVTEHLTKLPHFLGRVNTKNMVVFGNGGFTFGYHMENGNVTVKGNTDGSLGSEMRNGEILVEGNSDDVGFEMKGGKIEVKGSICSDLPAFLCAAGFFMEDGLIIISNAKDIDVGSGMKGGKIIVENSDRCILGEEMLEGLIKINSGVVNAVGENAKGGRIDINGEIQKLFKDCNTEIYHNGKKLNTSFWNVLYYNKLRKNERIRKLFG